MQREEAGQGAEVARVPQGVRVHTGDDQGVQLQLAACDEGLIRLARGPGEIGGLALDFARQVLRMHTVMNGRKAVGKCITELLGPGRRAHLGFLHGQHHVHLLPGFGIARQTVKSFLQGGERLAVVGDQDQVADFLQGQGIGPGVPTPVRYPVLTLPGANPAQSVEIGDAGEQEAQGGIQPDQGRQGQDDVGRLEGQGQRDQQGQPGQEAGYPVQHPLGHSRRRVGAARALAEAGPVIQLSTAAGKRGQARPRCVSGRLFRIAQG